jgi:glycosyltransferase involved in cell wall biosynthesis
LGRIFFKNRKIKYVLHQITFSIAPNQERRLLENSKVISESGYFDAIITSNHHMREKFYPQNLHDRLFIVPIGVNLDHFKPSSPSEVLDIKRRLFKTEDKIFVYEGTFSGRKLEILVSAFGMVLQRYAAARLLIIGSGDGSGSLNKLSRSLGIEEKVRFTGMVPYNDVARYVSAADIGVSYIPLTEYYDVQTPLKTMEFLASGLPVIATATKANKDLIKDGYNGLLTEESKEAMADAMFLLISNDELRKKLAQNARESVTRLNWKNIVQNELIPAYGKILQR